MIPILLTVSIHMNIKHSTTFLIIMAGCLTKDIETWIRLDEIFCSFVVIMQTFKSQSGKSTWSAAQIHIMKYRSRYMHTLHWNISLDHRYYIFLRIRWPKFSELFKIKRLIFLTFVNYSFGRLYAWSVLAFIMHLGQNVCQNNFSWNV